MPDASVPVFEDRLYPVLFPALLLLPAMAGIGALTFLYALLRGLDIQAVPYFAFSDLSFVLVLAAAGGAASIVLLPGVLAGRARDFRFFCLTAVFLFVSVGAMASYRSEIWFQGAALTFALNLVCVVVVFYNQREKLGGNNPFQSRITSALVLAAVFGLMAFELLFDAPSPRATLTGQAALAMTGISLVCAFYGTRMPHLYTLLMGLGLFFIWLAVPAVGLEAYMHPGQDAADTLPGRPFYASGWKWLLGFCAVGLGFGLRLLIIYLDERRKAQTGKGI